MNEGPTQEFRYSLGSPLGVPVGAALFALLLTYACATLFGPDLKKAEWEAWRWAEGLNVTSVSCSGPIDRFGYATCKITPAEGIPLTIYCAAMRDMPDQCLPGSEQGLCLGSTGCLAWPGLLSGLVLEPCKNLFSEQSSQLGDEVPGSCLDLLTQPNPFVGHNFSCARSPVLLFPEDCIRGPILAGCLSHLPHWPHSKLATS